MATMDLIDLRSDTVTRPDDTMRAAMAAAEVGDDVYGEDPTVRRLEAVVAERTGHEAALFFPTGTMSNQAALATLAGRGTEVILPSGGHVYEYEIGAMSLISGLTPRPVPAPAGVPDLRDVRNAVHRSPHQAPTGMLVIENTHNKAGGTVIPLDVQDAWIALAREENLPVHLDGARVYNAAVALGEPLDRLTRAFDTVSVCLSKGLGAPAGTVLAGGRDLMATAHRYRKALGGGMRQVGVLAAAGLDALERGPERLADDHRRARTLAERVAAVPGLSVNLETVHTNMVYVTVEDAPSFAARLKDHGVLANAMGVDQVRLVTHHHITDAQVDRAADALAAAATASAGTTVQA
jgi:threonine aldolase